MPKLSKIVSVAVMVLVLACGAVTIRIDTEVSDETEIKHDFQMEASGQMAVLMAEQFNQDEIDGDCRADIDTVNEEFSLSCNGLSQEGLAEEQWDEFDLNITKTDLGDQWEYTAMLPNPFFGAEEELKDNPLAQGMTMDAVLKLRFYWTVDMPGDIVESNANTYEDGTASFTVKLDDERETLAVVSQQSKGGSSCN